MYDMKPDDAAGRVTKLSRRVWAPLTLIVWRSGLSFASLLVAKSVLTSSVRSQVLSILQLPSWCSTQDLRLWHVMERRASD